MAKKESEDFGYSHPSVPVARHSGGGIGGSQRADAGTTLFFLPTKAKNEMSGE
jgi:hypothetical protein